MTQAPSANFLSNLKALSDDELSSALALDPDLIRKAQKAIVEAKRKEAEAAKIKNEQTAAAAGRPFDGKAWAKAKKLLTGPHNEANAAEFTALMAKTDPNIAPEGEKSLMAIALEYLNERKQVMLEWPLLVFKSGAKMNYPEIESLCRLFASRSFSDLGDKSKDLFLETFLIKAPWAEYEEALGQSAILGKAQKSLIEFYRGKVFASSYGGAACSKAPKAWEGLENLVASGCVELSNAPENGSYRPQISWESLISQPTENPAASQAKVSAFSLMIDKGWCDKGYTGLTDNLIPHQNKTNLKNSSLINCGSRSCINHLPLESSSFEIFTMLCERESQQGFTRYDDVGRSRLYFINEKLRQCGRTGDDPKKRKIIMALAQKALDLGDPPESLNPQNPLARASDQGFSEMIAAAIDKREISGVSATTKVNGPRSRSL